MITLDILFMCFVLDNQPKQDSNEVSDSTW